MRLSETEKFPLDDERIKSRDPNELYLYLKSLVKKLNDVYFKIANSVNKLYESGGSGTPSNTVVEETSYGQSPSAGTSDKYSRGDHTHGTPAHTKAIHDTLGINADTVDGFHHDQDLRQAASPRFSKLGINKAPTCHLDISGPQPIIKLSYSTNNIARIFQAVDQKRLDISINAYYDGSWNRDDIESGAAILVFFGSQLIFYSAQSGSNPISWTEIFRLNNQAPHLKLSGQIQITGGSPGANKVLTSDVYGLGSWKSHTDLFQKARAYRGSAQSIPNTTFTKIGIDTISFNPNNIVDTTNNRIKPTKAGYYFVHGQAAIDLGGAGSDFFTVLRKNGTDVAMGSRLSFSNQIMSMVYSVVSDLIYFDGTSDYVELFCYQASGTSRNLEISSVNNFLSIVGPF